MSLPTEKRAPTPGMGKVLIYGAQKIGKSTLTATMDPDHTIRLETEPGGIAIEQYPVAINSWDGFRQTVRELHQEEHPFTTAVVDTVDVLAQLCGVAVLTHLSGGTPDQYAHASDFEYGKGWSAWTQEFSLRVGALCTVVPNVVFVSHSDETVKTDRTGQEYTVHTPALAPKGIRNWLLGYVDHILFAELGAADERLLRTQPTRSYQAGGRTPLGAPKLPDPLPLEGPALKQALEALAGPVPAAKPKQSRGKAKPANGSQEGAEAPSDDVEQQELAAT